MRFDHSLLAFALLFALSACSSTFGQGVSHYERAEYPQALEALVSIEDESRAWSPKKRAKYALYRGLSHFALGNTELAREWLSEAKDAYDDDHSVFSDQDAGKLASAWAHLPSP